MLRTIRPTAFVLGPYLSVGHLYLCKNTHSYFLMTKILSHFVLINFISLLALILALIRPAQNEMYLFWVSHAILGTFLLLEQLLSFFNDTRLVIAPTMLFTYITYSLLPVRLQQAIVAGFILSFSQLMAGFLNNTSITDTTSVSMFKFSVYKLTD